MQRILMTALNRGIPSLLNEGALHVSLHCFQPEVMIFSKAVGRFG